MNLTEALTLINIAGTLVGILAALTLIVFYLQYLSKRDGKHGHRG